ncbi:MAG: hypothetical protein JSW08_02620 [archaeon]|nr:MAG: hypothetical protein JSW08_02620 [archaeon]
MKKGQFKIQEMAFVLVAVVILFGLVFLFFARFELGRVQDVAEELREDRAITLTRTVASMPELRCSRSVLRVSEAACLDIDKVESFNNSASLRESYDSMWKSNYVTSIVVEEIYPDKNTYYIYNRGFANESYFSFMPLCSEDKCVIARLIVGINL